MKAAERSLMEIAAEIEALAAELGLDYYPVDFELVPGSFMMEVAVYGLPVRMRHWSFGVRYIHQLIHQNMGNSRIFEVMFPGNPCQAYLVQSNSLAENILVTAHVLGHADFAKNNHLFAHFMDMAGCHILQQSAARAHRIELAIAKFGQHRVEAILDAALALEPHIDIHQPLHRLPLPAGPHADTPAEPDAAEGNLFRQRFRGLPGALVAPPKRASFSQAPVPAPEYDLLWFIARHAPDLEDWERDIFLAVREESFYFYPVFACQIMNEGWACYWHARLLREARFIPDDLYISAIKSHSDVVRPYASGQQLALALNPYHLGFSMWENIIEKFGLEVAKKICQEEDDFGFIRNYLDSDLVEKLGLFIYQPQKNGEIVVSDHDINAIKESILAPKFNFGAPRIGAVSIHNDGSLELMHDHQGDGRGLDLAQAERVLDYIARVWRRPISLHTVDLYGTGRELKRHANLRAP